jgi:hypothetical protein
MNEILQMKAALRNGDKGKLEEIVAVLRGNKGYTTEQIQLMQRVQGGKKWLEENENSDNYARFMAVYQNLVDDLHKVGISEEEAWAYSESKQFEQVFGLDAEEVN